MASRRRSAWRTSWGLATLLLCAQYGTLRGEPGTGTWTPPDELLTAQHLSKLITSNQWYAASAGFVVLLVLLAIAYLIPLIRAPRWQILGLAVVPLVATFATLAALSRSIARGLQQIPYDELRNVIDSELAAGGDKALAEQVLKWQGEVEGRSFLLDIASLPISATFIASAVLLATLWLVSHHRVLRAS